MKSDVDISDIIAGTDTGDAGVISYGRVKKSILLRKDETHKGDYGRIFIVAGSKGLTGAAIMASKAALRSGGGLITLGCAESLNSIFEIALHEVMTLPLPDDGKAITRYSADAIVDKASKSSVLLFGCGLSDTQDVYSVLKSILRNVHIPVVIDADGINAMSRNIYILKTAKCPVIITPHMGEFSRLTGLSAEDIMADKERIASEFATEYGVTLVLKSHETIIAHSNGKVRRNVLGNPGMATGGSGDVLAGVIASFIGQGLEHAVECGVYIHSLAGDMAAVDKGEYGMIPTDIIENLPYAIKHIVKG
ncbi:MAG: NAD(P)H-hydrate dehydratase [Clostridia bacterium]|nr:NAD(P)H-hydrate dehydratase [Clostridia bacterium]